MDKIHGHYAVGSLLQMLHQRKSLSAPVIDKPPALVFLDRSKSVTVSKTPRITPQLPAVIQEKALKYPLAANTRTSQSRRPSVTSKPELSISPDDTEEVQALVPIVSATSVK